MYMWHTCCIDEVLMCVAAAVFGVVVPCQAERNCRIESDSIPKPLRRREKWLILKTVLLKSGPGCL